MATIQLAPPYPVFTDKNGDPLDNGYLYFGVVDLNPETNPIQVYYDSTFTQPVAQPIRTSNGYPMRNGAPALIFAGSQFSVTVRDKNSDLVIYSPVGYGVDPGSIAGVVVVQDHTGDGVTTIFGMGASPSSENATNAYIDGVYQNKSTYSISGSTLTFSEAPPLYSAIEIVSNQTAIIGGTDAGLVSYNEGDTGAVDRTVKAKLQESVSVKDFGAVGDGVTDDTAAIQAAIDSGSQIIFPAGNYLSGPLTQSANFQRFYADGHVNITKNANGVLLTSSGNYVELDGLQFIGTGFTGDNINLTGSHPRLINCSSYGTSGRPLKATGNHVQIIGTCGSYSTTDATASGYDIEVGVSGTATLYHQLVGVYTSQPTGGILLVDTGSHVISGGQFGKLTIDAGTTPAGANGGVTSNARILGDVLVELSNSVFTGNQFSNQTITFALGTSTHSLDTSNITVGTTIVNSGNSNSTILKSTGTGSPTGVRIQYGSDAFNSTVRYSNDQIYIEDSNLNFANGKAIKFADTGGTLQNGVVLSGGDDWTFGSNTGANFTNVISGSGGLYAVCGGSTIAQFYSGGLRPQADGASNLGTASQRWNTVYATTGTINTSDANEKQDIAELDDAEKRVAIALKGMVKKFRFKDAFATKGDSARIHVGVIAQEVEAAFSAEGLDASRYGIFCYDEWEETPEVLDADGNVVSHAVGAGHRRGVRYEELLAFIIAAM